MKKILFLLFAFLNCQWMMAQQQAVANGATTLSIAADKTTTLVFPCAVSYVDRGTADVLVKAVKEAPGKLLVKGARTEFSPTSLSVMTVDGRVYCFILRYGTVPALLYHVPPDEAAEKGQNGDASLSPMEIKSVSTDLLHRLEKGRIKSVHGWEMSLDLVGIAIKKDVLFLTLELSNSSYIPYDIASLRFLITDRKKPKRTALQEQELEPLLATGNLSRVDGNSSERVVVALPKFTLPNQKKCILELSEKGGGRWLHLRIKNRQLLQARPV